MYFGCNYPFRVLIKLNLLFEDQFLGIYTKCFNQVFPKNKYLFIFLKKGVWDENQLVGWVSDSQLLAKLALAHEKSKCIAWAHPTHLCT